MVFPLLTAAIRIISPKVAPIIARAAAPVIKAVTPLVKRISAPVLRTITAPAVSVVKPIATTAARAVSVLSKAATPLTLAGLSAGALTPSKTPTNQFASFLPGRQHQALPISDYRQAAAPVGAAVPIITSRFNPATKTTEYLSPQKQNNGMALTMNQFLQGAQGALGALGAATGGMTGQKPSRIVVVTDQYGNQRVMKLVAATARIQKRRRSRGGGGGQMNKMMQMALISSMMRK